MLVEFEKKNLTGGIFLKLGAKNYFGIEKISFFGNYIDPWIQVISFRFTEFFMQKKILNFFSLIFIIKLDDEPFRYEEIFIISLFQKFRFGFQE